MLVLESLPVWRKPGTEGHVEVQNPIVGINKMSKTNVIRLEQ